MNFSNTTSLHLHYTNKHSLNTNRKALIQATPPGGADIFGGIVFDLVGLGVKTVNEAADKELKSKRRLNWPQSA